MRWKLPYLQPFFSKLFCELLPAAIASVIGGMLFSHFAKAPAATPVAAITAPADKELIQMVRAEHELFVESLKKHTDARQRADEAAESQANKLKASEKAALLALREARAAEARTLALAARAAELAEKKVATRQPAAAHDNAAIDGPLPLRPAQNAAVPVRSVAQTAAAASSPAEPSGGQQNIVLAKLRDVAATVERIPSWIHSATDWLSDDNPPRPPVNITPRNFLNAAM